ncbi:MAG: DNA polymerase Y family protein [Sphingomicrobium sp.]
MTRVLSIWLPSLAIERWAKASAALPDSLVALTIEGAHGPVIHAVTSAAAGQGARPGMRLTDARTLHPELIAVPADPAGDEAALRRLARWALRWSPLVEVDGADGLRLDVGGVAHLFGGEAGLIADVEERFEALGLTLRSAVAATAGAAWALARYYDPSPLAGEGGARRAAVGGRGERELAVRLAPLPVAALRLSSPATRTLERLGLKTIGALAGIERRSLARRFREADNPLDALDRALGRKLEPLTAEPVEVPPRATLRLAEPVDHPEAGAQALNVLVPRLVAELEARKLGARTLSLAGFRVDGSVASASVATAIPSRDPAHLARLLTDKAETLDPRFGFDAFALTAEWSEPLGAAQSSLVEESTGELEVARLIDRLSVKLGPRAVRRPQARGSHLPEQASGWVGAVANGLSPLSRRGVGQRGFAVPAPLSLPPFHGSFPPPQGGEGVRKLPQRLLDQPEVIAVIYSTPEGVPRRFVWRRGVHDIARVEGPERIAPEWWRQAPGARLRDYYRVEDDVGRRYWIYREGVIGDGRGRDQQGIAPMWFLHGLFG